MESLLRRYTSTGLFLALSPIFLLMKLCGLYFTKCYEKQPERRRSCRRFTISQIFSTFILVLHWLNFVRHFTLFNREDEFGPRLCLKVIFFSYSFIVAVNATCCYQACYRADLMPHVFLFWSSMSKCDEAACVRYVRRKALLLSIVSAFFMLVLHFTLTWRYFSSESYDDRFAPFTEGHALFMAAKVTFCVFDLFVNAAWVLPMVEFCGLSAVIVAEYNAINTDLASIISNEDTLKRELSVLRARHQAVCELVELVDSFVSVWLATSFVFCVVEICVMAYMIACVPEFQQDPMLLFLTIFWLMSSAVYITICCSVASYVNSKAHAAFGILHRMNISDATEGFSLQVNLFMARITGGPIGFSVSTLFVIDKASFLTVMGALTTYFLLLLQFNPPSTSTQAPCDCSSWIYNTSMVPLNITNHSQEL